MEIIVPFKVVPDLVEELTVDENGTALDEAWLRLKLNEFDDHAIEQAILLKEMVGGNVTLIAPDVEGVEDAFFMAAAKGADHLLRLTGDFEGGLNNHALARALALAIQELSPDLVLTGVQAHNDLDGALGPLLAGYLGLPYIGYVAGVKLENGVVLVRKEYPGGVIAEMTVTLPAVLGIQVAESPPRYVAFSKIRQAMKTTLIQELPITTLDLSGGPTVSAMFPPESTERARMIEGEPEEVASGLIEIFREMGVI